MTFPSTHPRERSARRRRSIRIIAPVALLVLLGQVVLPHLHAAQTGSHATSGDARGHRPPGVEHDTRAAIEGAASPAAREHSESRCPVCQTLAHAHDFLPTTSRQQALPDARIAAREALDDARRAGRVIARAPRSPPFAA